jgi:hypothetical protein
MKNIYRKHFDLSEDQTRDMTIYQAYGTYGDAIISEEFNQNYDGVDLSPLE